jgi:regulator of sigma E protease
MDIFAAAGDTVWTVFFFIVALSIIVFVHEYGHYIVGRWSGIHSEVFSLGFGPVLWTRTDKRGTRWQIAAIPFGGYVKFLGDADATSVRAGDVSGLTAAERRHTMAGAPLWARAATVAAGPVFNFILTFLVLGGMLVYTGVPREEITVERLLPTPFEGPSLLPGDVVLAMNGTPVPDADSFGSVVDALPEVASIDYTVRRDGAEVTVKGPNPLLPVVVMVLLRSAAMDAGLQEGDVILTAAGRQVTVFRQLPGIVAEGKGAAVPLKIWRDGKTFDVTLTPRIRSVQTDDGGFVDKYQIGLGGGLAFELANRHTGVWETISLTGQAMWRLTTTTFSGLWHTVAGKISSCNFSGVIGMAETMGDAARSGTQTFVEMMAVLSLGVGILNLFPIPVLDGGHLVFHAYEAVMRRPPSARALQVLMTAGLAFVVSLMIFALSRDLVCV